jgi:hypothetical protein
MKVQHAGEGTTTGGLNWIEYLTVIYNKTLVFNYDLAVGGAVIDNNIVANPGYTHDLVSQVAVFGQYYANRPASAPWMAHNSVFGIWIGVNEYVPLSYASFCHFWSHRQCR